MKSSNEHSPSFGEEYHVVSLVCQSIPEKKREVMNSMESIDGVEVHGTDHSGKVVVTVEGPSPKYLAQVTEQLQNVSHVLLVTVIYHEYLLEPTQELKG